MCCMVSLRLPNRDLLFPPVSVPLPAGAGGDGVAVTMRRCAVVGRRWHANGSAVIMVGVLSVTATKGYRGRPSA